MEIKTKLIPQKTAARSGYSMTPKYITIHNTANTRKGADAASHATYLQNDGKNQTVSYHYVVDDKLAYKLLPDNEVAWHAGDGSKGTGNRQSLSIEICENIDGNLLKATDNAAELTAQLMKAHNIPLANVVQHNKWSGKDCPARIRKGQPYDWQTFLKKVQSAYSAITKPATNTTTTKPTTTTVGIAAGTKLTLNNTALYTSSSTTKKAANRSGTYYIWSKDVVNSRIRITNSTANVGRTGQVTGWINLADAKKCVSTATAATSKPAAKSLDDWAKEVIAGKYGNGILKRTLALKKAGCPYSYAKVQSRVNALLKK